MIDERHEELASLYAFDLLEGPELTAFEITLAGDPALQALVRELRSITVSLAHTAPPATPPPELRARILATVATSARPAAALIPFPSRAAWLPWAVAACFAFATAWSTQRYLVTRAEADLLRDQHTLAELTLRSERQQLEAERILARTQLVALSEKLKTQGDLASLKIATLSSLLGNSPQALAVAVWDADRQEGTLKVEKLPALASDQDYQLWVVDPQYPIPVDGGVFTVDPATGDARLNFHPGKPVKTAAKFAISRERKGGVPKAEGPMVLLGP